MRSVLCLTVFRLCSVSSVHISVECPLSESFAAFVTRLWVFVFGRRNSTVLSKVLGLRSWRSVVLVSPICGYTVCRCDSILSLSTQSVSTRRLVSVDPAGRLESFECGYECSILSYCAVRGLYRCVASSSMRGQLGYSYESRVRPADHIERVLQ